MAMRPRGGGRDGPSTRPHRAPRPGVRPVYEDFRPISERHQEERAEKLLIFLPGFLKESLRVSTEGKNTVRVRGERFVGGNKWNRFQEDYQAPENCNLRGIHAKFENGILIITMPCKMPKQLLDEHTKQPPLTTPPPPHKDDDVPPKTSYPTIETQTQPTPLKPTAQLPKPQNADKDQTSRVQEKQREKQKIFDDPLKSAETSKSQKGDDVPSKTTYPTIEAPRKPTPLKPRGQLPKPQNVDKDQDSRGVLEKQRDEKKIMKGQVKSAETSKTRKGDDVPSKTTYPTIEAPRKPTPLKPRGQLPKPQNVDKDQDSRGVLEKQRDERKIMEGKTSGKREKTKDEKKILEGGKKVAEKSKELIGEIQEKVEQKGPKEKQSASNLAAGTSSYHGSEFSIDNLKKSFVGQNEERQLLVNAGAAVLVIMALGAYVYHSIGSGRAK
ncbi:inactive protein RESTRICTED TEV MOVEMENT 2-like isoform X2 [Lycium ferocissimum]|uniref:inactive protein RESTRICTED TEV MOVEMENT 2-like isoform X2 n=1 Tax=Lycium ferocissimum TaxID=112874 RepID=UPI0028157090|nr:inactive protein RESTRICTED TEV MOVEMENT 2-like isoform X2 [Lycium ferocissimum]